MHIYFVVIILASTCICSQGGNFNPLGLFPCQCCQSVWCLCIPYLFSNIFCTVWFPYLHSQRFWQMIRRRRNYDFDIPTHERCFFCKRFLSLVQFSHNTIFNEIEISNPNMCEKVGAEICVCIYTNTMTKVDKYILKVRRRGHTLWTECRQGPDLGRGSRGPWLVSMPDDHEDRDDNDDQNVD